MTLTPPSGLGRLAGVAQRAVTEDEARRASRHWWDVDADNYLADHVADLGEVDFLWCPEGLREDDARLLGDPATLAGKAVLEIGCGSAPVARWLAAKGALPVGLDLSGAMLRHAAQANERAGIGVPLIQADATELPCATESFDLVVSDADDSHGSVARVVDALQVIRLVANIGDARSLVNHPASMTHSHLTAGQRAAAGISLTTIRLSAGLEDPADLIADLDRALALA